MGMLDRVEMKVRGWLGHKVSRWRHIRGRRIRVMRKLDESKVRWIVRQKRRTDPDRPTTARIAETMGVSAAWVKKLWARYRHAGPDGIAYPARMGRPENGIHGRREHSAVIDAHNATGGGAGTVRAAMLLEGINIPHRTVHRILREDGSADRHPRKSRRRKWVRYERTHSNSMWHTDWKQIRGGVHDGRWFLCYEDDASRFVTGYGIFDEATSGNALAVLERAIRDHGSPASIMTDHGSQFYASEKEAKKRGENRFEKKLVELGIRQILAGVGHPQTNGKLERLHGEIQRKLRHFEGSSYGTAVKAGPGCHVGGPFHAGSARDPMERFIDWYNNSRAHMSLDWENQETPAQAFVRKMAPKGKRVIDAETGEEYDAS